MFPFRPAFAPMALAAAVFCTSALAQEGLRAPTLPEAHTTQISPDGVLRRPLAYGVYQLVVSSAQQALYVASAEYRPHIAGGVIYKLDPQTLETTGLLHTDEKNFGLAIDAADDTLFTTSGLTGSVSKIDLKTDQVVGRIVFSERNAADGRPYGTRVVMYDSVDHLLYVGGATRAASG